MYVHVLTNDISARFRMLSCRVLLPNIFRAIAIRNNKLHPNIHNLVHILTELIRHPDEA